MSEPIDYSETDRIQEECSHTAERWDMGQVCSDCGKSLDNPNAENIRKLAEAWKGLNNLVKDSWRKRAQHDPFASAAIRLAENNQ